MRYMLVFLTALLTTALGVVALRALPWFSPGAAGVGAVAGGVSETLTGLLVALSVLFIVLLVIHRRRERRRRT